MLVTIMRGVPGSGKTWWHTHQYPDNETKRVVVCSADHHFMDSSGEYHFRPDQLSKAHGFCLQKFVQELVEAHTAAHVIVDNTNVSAVEMAPYIALATAYGVPYEIVRVQPRDLDAVALAKRCAHGVPADTIGRMMYNLKNNEIPRFWKRERVIE